MILQNSNRRFTLASAALLLLAVLLFCPGCSPREGGAGIGEPIAAETEKSVAEGTQEPIAAKTETSAGTAPNAGAEPVAEPERNPVHGAELPDLSAYGDLVLSKVYGNGGSGSAACAHSFIELTNTGADPVGLGGLALYYRTGSGAEYASFPLPDTALDGGRSYLIRGLAARDSVASNASAGDRAKNAVLLIEAWDAEWDITLDNREIRLVLAPAGLTPGPSVPPEEFPGMISCFAASDGYHFDTAYVSGMTKNTVAVRTAMTRDSGYYLQDLTKATTEKLEQIAPAAMSGERAVILGSGLEEVRFSHAAGFYSSQIALGMTAPAGFDTIYYTTDGSDPTSSGTRSRYTGAVLLSDTTRKKFGETYKAGVKILGNVAASADGMIGGHVIKACAYDGERYTPVYTNSYFISAKMEEYGVTVMSVSLETEQMFGDPGFYHNFDPSSNEPNTRGMAFMEVFDKSGVRRGYSNVELAASGHGSSGTGMKSMKVFYKGSENTEGGTEARLSFDLFGGWAVNAKGQRITDFSRLVLRNSGNDHKVSYIRDAYMQRVSRKMAADTMAYAPVLLFVNGDFWGVYNARERYSGDYVQSHYGIDKDNVALVESDYSKVHTNQNAKFIVTSGLADDADDFNELVRYIRKNSMKQQVHYDYVRERMDIDSLIDLFVSRLYFSALDFPGNNIKVWRNRAENDPSGTDNRWHFVLLDMDMGISFYKGANDTTETSNYFSWLSSGSTVASTIIYKLLANPDFKNRFMGRFYYVLNEVYVPARLIEELDRITEEREPVEKLQTLRWGADLNKYRSSVKDMRKFVLNRYKYALRFLCSHFDVTEEDLKKLGRDG